jgi:hypothetical protein
MATSVSGLDPYCTVDQLLLFYDERSIRQLLSDTGTAVTGSLTANEIVLEMLKAASGWVEAAACTGQRYVINSSRNDLAALTGNSAKMLAKMVADLAMFDLWSRRPNLRGGEKPPTKMQMSLDFFEQLRLGERVFGILENHQAAALDSVVETRRDVEDRNGVVTEAERYFGTRNNRLGRRP